MLRLAIGDATRSSSRCAMACARCADGEQASRRPEHTSARNLNCAVCASNGPVPWPMADREPAPPAWNRLQSDTVTGRDCQDLGSSDAAVSWWKSGRIVSGQKGNVWMSCGTVSGFETPLVRAYAVGEGVTRERESVSEAAIRRNSDRDPESQRLKSQTQIESETADCRVQSVAEPYRQCRSQ
jgi:hypothetical protein